MFLLLIINIWSVLNISIVGSCWIDIFDFFDSTFIVTSGCTVDSHRKDTTHPQAWKAAEGYQDLQV